MSEFASAEQIEQWLETYGKQLKTYMRNREFAKAKYAFQMIKIYTNGVKLRILGITLKAAGAGLLSSGGKESLDRLETLSVKLTQRTLANIDYQEKIQASARLFGRAAKVVGMIGLVSYPVMAKDLYDAAEGVVHSSVEQMKLKRIALYDDYLEEYKASSQMTDVKTYQEWMSTDYLPALHRKQSEFFREFHNIFPDATIGF